MWDKSLSAMVSEYWAHWKHAIILGAVGFVLGAIIF